MISGTQPGRLEETGLIQKRLGHKKRGACVPLVDQDVALAPLNVDLLALDAALLKLGSRYPRQAQLIELKFFGGLTVEETAAVLGVSPITVKRDWAFAKAWLYREVAGPARMTTGSSWDALRALFEAALQRPPAERAAFLRAQTGSDDATRREVEDLLAAHHQAGDYLEDAAIGAGRDRDRDARSSAPRLAAGRRLGAFEILGPLGAGGMGEVYRARDTRLDRLVAVKVLSAQAELGSRGRERFEREARAISKLAHPHICMVHDVGAAQIDDQEVPFLILELLDGETLAACLARGRLTVAHALRYAIDIADALATAHARGIVHRDLKPSNVMVTASGVKLLDFGLALLRDPGPSREGAPAPNGARHSIDECRDGARHGAVHVP